MIAIRDAGEGDILAIAEIQVATWHDTYRGVIPDEFLDTLAVSERAAMHQAALAKGKQIIVAELCEREQQRIAGFASFGTWRPSECDADIVGSGPVTEIYAIYVEPTLQRSGAGRRLLDEVVRRVSGQQSQAVALWVLRDNAKGRAFYEKLGGNVAAERVINIGGKDLVELAYKWSL